ncbi:AsmA-like C-terminal region-containing protein [Microvirga sp. W0021]|uniref:AsmA-like C-terminal region-containing protein n=1 Tax=Hohaiivirga grylli TaxID=3133970 RepID=A0ABV0BJT5_9HYPH
MTDSENKIESADKIAPHGKRKNRFFIWFLGVLVALVVLASAALGGLYLRLQNGPLSFPGLSSQVISSMSNYFESDWQVTLNDSALELDHGSFALRIRGLEIRNGEGKVQLRAPNTIISVDTFSLLFGRLTPKIIEFLDLQVVGAINNDGSITFIPVEQGEIGISKDATPTQTEINTVASEQKTNAATYGEAHGQSMVSQGVEAFINIVAGTDGPLGLLKRAEFTNLRLTLIDNRKLVRARFSRVDAKFERTVNKGRTFEASMNSVRGNWKLWGYAMRIDRGYQLSLNLENAPVQDLLFLSGLSSLPASTTLNMSGKADVTLVNGILNKLEGTFRTGEGRIDVHDKDATPLYVDNSLVEVSWNEAIRQMAINKFDFKAGDTDFHITGAADIRANQPWRVKLQAKDSVLSGVTPSDKPFQVDTMEAEATGNGVITLDRLYFKGPDLDVQIKGTYGNATDPKAIAVDIALNNTQMRSVMRLWPEITASGPRRYLLKSLLGGIADKGTIHISLAGDVVKGAMNGGSIPDDSLFVDFDVRDGTFLPTEGLPHLKKANVKVKVTGENAYVQGTNAVIDFPGNRVIKVPTVSFDLINFWNKSTVGIVKAQVESGADALTAFLKLPKTQEAFTWDVKPEDIKGNVNLALEIGLAINDIPKFAELPIKVSGKITNMTLEKALGEDRLEKADFDVSYDTGTLAMKGAGMLAGYPATIVVNQPAVGKGTGVLNFSLDDAARARKGLDFGSQMTGIMPVKVTLDLGAGEHNNYRVEADLTKIAINNLIPGWVKPSGRAGKLSLFAVEKDDGTDINDMQLDAGIRFSGKATLDDDGNFIRADLSRFQLSQGDDMQVKVSKADNVFKTVIRGNLGDARPVIKALTGSSSNSSQRGQANDSRNNNGLNLDLDLMLNILTGFNDEAITRANIKAGVRSGSLRQLQMTGKIGSAVVTGQTTTSNGSPSITVQSANAGSFLRYFDVYRRIYNGDLLVEMAMGNGSQNGFVMVRNFSIRNEPALKRIVPSQTQGTGSRRIDINDVAFTKARVDFVKNNNRIDFKDGAIWGMQIGFTLDGYMDFARNQLDVAGTFVPAYGLNNAFAQVPILGTILGGGQYGGLFGVNFRLTGNIGSPAVAVNPLSAVAPGIFRKLFGTGGQNAPVAPDR